MASDRISDTLDRYLLSLKTGKEVYFDADEIDEALECLEDSEEYSYFESLLMLGLKLHPNNVSLKIRLCKYLVYIEEYEDAISFIDSTAEPDNIDLQLSRLECFCGLDQYPKVIEYIERKIEEKSPDLLELFEGMAPIISDFDVNTEALDFIKRGLALFPDSLILKDELCIQLEATGDYEKAIVVCNGLINEKPYSAEYWYTLGRLHSMLGDYDKAIEAFDFSLTCDDSDIEVKILKAYCYYMNNDYENALQLYVEIKTEDNDQENRVIPLMTECLIKQKKFDEAYVLLKKLIADFPQTCEPSVFTTFIRCCIETYREDEAIDALHIAKYLFKDDIQLLSTLVVNLSEKEQDERTVNIMNILFEILDISDDELNEIAERFKEFDSNNTTFVPDRDVIHILPENLTKEYLKNKDNSN